MYIPCQVWESRQLASMSVRSGGGVDLHSMASMFSFTIHSSALSTRRPYVRDVATLAANLLRFNSNLESSLYLDDYTYLCK